MIKTLIKEVGQIISLAVKNAKGDGSFDKEHFKAAEETWLFKDWNMGKNGYVKRLIGFSLI